MAQPQQARFHGRTVLSDETYEALVFDWDGTVVPDRQADAKGARERVEALSDAGVHMFVVSGTHVENVDGQLRARPHGRGHLFFCCNRGSEVFEVTDEGPQLLYRRTASVEEDRALDLAAAQTVDRLRERASRHGSWPTASIAARSTSSRSRNGPTPRRQISVGSSTP